METLTTLKQLYQTRIHQQSVSLTLFDKLQILNTLSSQLKLKNTSSTILSRQALLGNIKNQQITNQNEIYNSPPQNKVHAKNKKYSIQDPQHFSFSKNNYSQNQQQQNLYCGSEQNKAINSPQLINFNNYSQKIKAINAEYSTKNRRRTKNNRTKRRVSQFKFDQKNNDKILQKETYSISSSSIAHQKHKQQSEPLHEKSSKLRNYLQYRYFNKFITIIKSDRYSKKIQLKMRSSQFIYQLKILQKYFKNLKIYKLHLNECQSDIINRHKQNIISNYFGAWRDYTYRSQQQRMREIQQNRKIQKIIKWRSIRKLINSTKSTLHHSQSKVTTIIYRKQVQFQKQTQIKLKIEELNKINFITNLRSKLQQKNQFSINQNRIKMCVLKFQNSVFIKLIKTLQQIQSSKLQKNSNQVLNKISCIKFINNLSKQYYFQKAYWKTPNLKSISIYDTTQQLSPSITQFKSTQQTLLPSKYSKIVFIHKILTLCQQSMYREGYIFNKNIYTDAAEYRSHHAVKQYLEPYIMKKYFNAIVTLIKQRKQKQKYIKYEIIGKKYGIVPLLNWYRISIKDRLDQQYVQIKKEALKKYIFYRRANNLLKRMQKNQSNYKIQQKYSLLANNKHKNMITKTLRILQLKNRGKKYYIKKIKAFKMKSQHRLQQKIFLQWKLTHLQRLHNNYLMMNIIQMRKMHSFAKFYDQCRQSMINNAIFTKRIKWIQKNTIIRQGNKFINNLQINSKTIIPNKQLTKHIKKQKLLKYLENNRINYVINTMKDNLLIKKYKKNIYEAQIPKYYETNLKFKIFKCLQKIRNNNIQQKIKIKKIQGFKKISMQKNIMKIMVNRLLQAMLLKRVCRIIGRYHKKIGIFYLQHHHQIDIIQINKMTEQQQISKISSQLPIQQ